MSTVTLPKWRLKSYLTGVLLAGVAVGSYLTTANIIIPGIYAATETSSSWSFATSSDYVCSQGDVSCSSSSTVEVISSSVRSKLRQYVGSESGTELLLHLDESSGNPDDASSNNHTVTNNSVSYTTTTGSFNNAASLDGGNSYLSVDDSVDLSLSGSHTIEAWYQMDTAPTATSHGNDQYIVDKGDYSLYFDHQAGKFAYKIKSNSAQSWTQYAGSEINGSWNNLATKLKNANAITQLTYSSTTYTYAGLGSNAGDSEVWRYDPGTQVWGKIGGDGLDSSWSDSTYEEVTVLQGIGQYLYVGLGNAGSRGEVWKWDEATDDWTIIGGPGNFGAGIERVQSMTNFAGSLVVGLGNTGDDGDVWRWNETSDTWEQIGGTNVSGTTINNGWTNADNIEIVNALASDGTYLYAGLGNTGDDGDVWRFDDSTDSWGGSPIGGTNSANVTMNTGWADADNIEGVLSLAISGTTLCAGLGTTQQAGDDDSEIWCVDLSEYPSLDWDQMAGNAVNSSWDNAVGLEGVYSLVFVGNTLYAGLGNTADDGDVWSASFASYPGSASTTWSQTGGTVVAATVGSAWDATEDAMIVASMYSDGTTLYVANRNNTNGAEIWTYTSGAWTHFAGQYVNESWGYYGLDTVRALATGATSDGSKRLYAGTGALTTANPGDALVFEFDGSNWSVIGGQGVRDSWDPSRIRVVNDLMYFKGYLYAAIGSSTQATTDDGEVWRYSVSSQTWERIANGDSDGTYSSWTTNDDVENVITLANDGTYVYAGLGSTVNGGTAPTSDDSMVWRFNPSSPAWVQYGGPNTSGTSVNTSWANSGVTDNHETVSALAYDGDYLYAGLGNSNDDADVWRVDVSAGTPDWEPIGGTDATTGTTAINSSWHANDNINEIMEMEIYKGDLYVGLGTTVNEAQVWKWNGTVWSQVGGPGGDDEAYVVYNNSWPALTFETVRGLAAMDGYLYAGLGNTVGEAEIWRFDGSTWTRVGGVSEAWATTAEQVWDLAVYEGRLFASFGNTAITDPQVWGYGGSAYLLYSSTTTTLGVNDTDMHYIVAKYNSSASTMSIFVDDDTTADTTRSSVSVTINDSTSPLYIGNSLGTGIKQGIGYLDGYLDELRITSEVVSSSDLIESKYSSSNEYVQPTNSVMTSGVGRYTAFSVTDNAEGTFTYQLSDDDGTTWKYWNGSSWVSASGSLSNSNSESVVNTNISSLPITDDGIKWRAIFDGNGTERPTITNVTVTGYVDLDEPNNPTMLTALSQSSGGSAISSGGTYPNPNPHFVWSGADDDNDDGETSDDSGIWGYDVYFGTDPVPDLDTYGTFQTGSTYTASNLVAGETYYFAVRSVDKAQNKTSTNYPSPIFSYTYNFASPEPNNVDYISPASGTFGNIAAMSFTWPTTGEAAASPYEGGPDIVGWQYALNSTADERWTGTYDDVDLAISYIPIGYTQPHYFSSLADGSNIVVGENTIYFRAVDANGDFADPVAGVINYGGAAPTFSENCSVSTGITVTPSSSDTNSFSLSWDPATPDDGNFVTNYYYMVNTPPPATLSTVTSNSAVYIDNDTETSVSTAQLPGSIKGSNLVYVIAVDDDENYASGNCLKGSFTLDSDNPDPPLNLTVSDASVKSSSLWRASLAWDEPSYKGTGTLTYKVQRSVDGASWTTVTTTSGFAHVDTVSDSTQYYWRVGTYDNSSDSQSSPSYANAVTLTPKGSYTTAPSLTSGPESSDITTKRATISWSTDRTSDSKVQYGTSSGSYLSEEPSNSDQVTSHEINLTNLEPGTTYYYKAKWTDEDGNTGNSDEKTFTTAAAPTVREVDVSSIGLDSAIIKFTTVNASSAKVYYGETTSFGGVTSVATGTNESEYTIQLTGLDDDTKYYYKINTYDSESAEYEGTTLDFQTLPAPKISTVRVQQVKGAAQPTAYVTWNTNTEVSSIVTYYPVGNPAAARDEVNVALTEGEHSMIIRGLLPNTPYTLIIKGRDVLGNEAQSDPQTITTATDTRPPSMSNLKVEGTVETLSANDNSVAQLVVSWDTDEPSTSQVEFGEGTGTTYSQKTQEDLNLTFNHIVVISGLTPSKVYHLRALSSDEAGNVGNSIDTVTITPKATKSALDLVINNLSEVFGFLGGLR